jgi:cytidylate kinase
MLESIIDNVSISFRKNETTGNNDAYLNNENVETEIRGLQVSNLVSPVSQLKFVRERMVQQQRLMGNEGGVILDGRDIGTVVFPNARIKIFMTAQPQVRAQRRFDELKAKGQEVSMQEIAQNIEQRDLMDTTRKESPLKQAPDAIVLDNSNMNPAQQMVWFKALYQRVINYD